MAELPQLDDSPARDLPARRDAIVARLDDARAVLAQVGTASASGVLVRGFSSQAPSGLDDRASR